MSGDLHHVGAPFAAFLREQFADTGYLYLADVAALEWAYQECLVAEEFNPLDPVTLARRARTVLWNTAVYVEARLPACAFTISRAQDLGSQSARSAGR